MNLSPKYKSVFELIKGNPKYDEIDTVIITGGRFSGKSFGIGIGINEATIQHDWKTLYTRFTNVSIEDSVKKEFVSAIELLGYEEYYNIQVGRIKSVVGERS